MSAGYAGRAAGGMRRLPGLFTLVVAVAWGAGAVAVADYVRDINSARVVGALMTGGLALDPALPGGSAAPPPGSRGDAGDPGQATRQRTRTHLARHTAFVERAVGLWLWSMLAAAALIGLLGLLSACVRRPRALHVLTAACLLACAAGTVTGMRLLVDPRYGALPPLPWVSYLCVGLVQSVYACLLLAMVLHDRRPDAGDDANARPAAGGGPITRRGAGEDPDARPGT